MELAYSIALIIHLSLAIIFLGYIFTDVIILPVLAKEFGKEMAQKIKASISSKAKKIMPPSVLFLVLTGGFMMTRYVNSELGYFNTSMQQLFMLKVLFASIIVLGIIFSLSYKALRGKPNPLTAKYLHKVALILGAGIIILAKLMFSV